MEGPGPSGPARPPATPARSDGLIHALSASSTRPLAIGFLLPFTILRPFPEVPVSTVSATEARRRLYSLIDEVGQSHQPVQIHGKRGNAVLLSEDDWRSIQETFHLLAIPGMRESILEGMATEASELTPEPGW